uniref:Heparan-alpha-glucosaminide N-acetyltransferase-like n=1 Tax=Hirondellea gigas TaxID=1518452 RepID=A0A2P2I1S4_9CRUS
MRDLTHNAKCLDSSSATKVHIGMDEACLAIYNTDASKTIELWGQTEECFKCNFMPYATVGPNGTASMVVNTTYSTLLSTTFNQAHLHGFKAHFKESGYYSLFLNETNYHITETHHHTAIYLPLLYAFIFYSMLFFVWQFAWFLRNRMDSGGDSSEASPILATSTRNSRSYGGTSVGNTADAIKSDTSNSPNGYHDTSPATTAAPAAATATETGITSLPETATGEEVATKRMDKRLKSLDVFRGITIFLMIFVNYGGGKYYFFRHSPWNGLTIADLVFPWFMWIMGVSTVFSFRSQLRKSVPRHVLVLRVIKRSVILFGLGLLVNGISNSNTETFRIPGVLQRFAICYLLTATLEALFMSVSEDDHLIERWGGWFSFRDIIMSWLQWSIVIGLVSIHTVITFVLPIPDCPRGYIGPGGLHDYGTHSNCTGGVAAYIDRLFFTSDHMYSGSTARSVYQNQLGHDPEGLLGILTSMLMVQFGVAAGRILITYDSHKQRILRLLVWAATSGLVGAILCNFDKEIGVVPVNKNLWSLSYVLVTACFGLVLFCFIYVLVDWKEVWSGNPARYAGLNSILLYVGHEITKGVFPFGWTPGGSTHGEHLLMNLWGTSLWGVIAYICHRKKLYLSV